MLKLFKNLSQYRFAVLGVALLTLIQSFSQLYLPTLMSGIIDRGIARGDTAYILRIGAYMLLVATFASLCAIASSYLSSQTSLGFGKTLRSKVFGRATSFSLHEFDKFGTASLITRTTNDINQVQNVVNMMLRMMISAPMTCIGGIIMAVSKDAKLSLIFLAAMPLLALAVALITSRGMPLFRAIQQKLDRLNLVLRENLTGIRVIRAFDRIEHERQRFDEANQDLTNTAISVNKIMAIMMPSMMLIMNFTTIAIIWFGGQRIQAGAMAVGDMMAFIQYATQILFSLLGISMMFVMIPRASVSAQRINDVLDTYPDIVDPLQDNEQTSLSGHVEFRNVTFSYHGAERPALENVSFVAEPGQVTAIIGGTGSGKSTLLSLILRFYDVGSGGVFVDGVDVRDLLQSTLRQKIGYVPQASVLFSGSVVENVRYGKNDADLAAVQAAAQIAQADDFVSALTDGYDALLAQGGTNLSGGQKQRLSIARALVRRPEIYLFDDSFSALDFKTDARLRAALKQVTNDATVLIVAQRVSTVMNADQIIVLEDGKVAGIGRHRELLENCGVYREIVSSQLSEEELA